MSHNRTTMWEAVAAEDQFRQLLEWATDVAVPDLVATDPGCAVQIYYSADNRVVITAVGSTDAPVVPELPEWLSQRTPHQWHFERLQCEFP
jgi:hypothetical protein